MREAAKLVIGTHDFTSFAASDPDLTTRNSDRGTRTSRSAEGNVRTIFESRMDGGWAIC